MAEAFPVSGNIDPTAFPHLLVDLHRHGATGSLKVNGPLHPKALYFRSGRILFGSSNDPRDQLGAILIESGRITREQLDDVNAKVGPGNPLAKVLAESGYVNQRELGDAARIKVERILADLLSWESGSFEFEDGVLPKGAVDLKLSTERLLLAAVQRITERAFALRHLGGLSAVLEAAPEGEAALSEVRAEVWPLLERLDGQRTLKDAIALTRLDEFDAAKIACAMLFLGILRRKAQSAEELDLAQEARIGLEETAPPTPPPEPPPFVIPEPEPAPSPLLAPREEPAGFAFADEEPKGGPEIAIAPPPVAPSPPSFTVDAPRPRPADTLPPPAEPPLTPPPTLAWTPPPEPPRTLPPARTQPPEAPRTDAATPPWAPPPPGPPPAFEPAPPPSPLADTLVQGPTTTSRPTREDLAALDALLSPSASGRVSRPPVERSRPQRWEPQFRPPTTPLRRPAASRAGGPKAPLIAAGLAAVVVGALAAWYFLLRPATAPQPTRVPTPVTRPTLATAPETLSAPATLAPAAGPSPGPTAAASPTTAPIVAPSPAVATAAPIAAPAPGPTPVAPRPTPPPAVAAQPPPAAAAGDARALLRGGSLPEAARGFASTLSPGARGRFSIQLLVACSPETVLKAVGSVASDDLFILPVDYKGRACYRMCWGVYDSRQGAETALAALPTYFRQGGATPRLQPLVDLLP
jgi:hypothetical protein